jgi:ribonuclease E
MTEKRGRRRFWRRGQRRKPSEEPEGAALAGEPRAQAGEEEAAETPAAAQEEAVHGSEPGREAGEKEPEGGPHRELMEVADAVASGAAERKSRRRRRRGGKRRAGEEPPPPSEAPPEAEAGGEGAGTVAEGEAGGAPGSEAPEETQAPREAAVSGEAPEGQKTGRRRGRRRRRRGGAPGREDAEAVRPGPAPGEAPADEGVPAGAEVTLSEEGRAPEEAEEEPGEAEGEELPAGKGPKKVMLIDGNHPEEIRVAIVGDGILDYFEVENQRRKQFKGNIYKGRVVNVAQSIEAAFVEFGGGRHGFLPLNEYCGGALIDNLESWDEGEKRPHLRPGKELLVQVTKEESAVKGAALTSYISIAGRYLVMMLGMKRYGISKKITGEKERERIRKNMEKLTYPEHLGFIVRTVGAGQPLKDLRADMVNLLKLWDRTVEGARTLKAPALLYEEQDIVIRTLRDEYSSDISEVLMDSPESQRKAMAFFDVYYPRQKNRLKLVRQKRPLFSKFNLEEQVERACARKVPLPSGGHIVLDRTEAIWTIDVNSGRSSRDRDIEETAYRTNREAAAEVTRQLRLRDMGGLIVVDFIDMENRSHNKEVEKKIKEGLKRDKARSDVSALGKFGLVAITRQRMGTSFHDVLMKACDCCAGTGFLQTSDASLVKLLRKVHEELSREPGKEILVRVSPSLLEALLNQKREEITRLEKLCGARVSFASDPSLAPGSFFTGDGPA